METVHALDGFTRDLVTGYPLFHAIDAMDILPKDAGPVNSGSNTLSSTRAFGCASRRALGEYDVRCPQPSMKRNTAERRYFRLGRGHRRPSVVIQWHARRAGASSAAAD